MCVYSLKSVHPSEHLPVAPFAEPSNSAIVPCLTQEVFPSVKHSDLPKNDIIDRQREVCDLFGMHKVSLAEQAHVATGS